MAEEHRGDALGDVHSHQMPGGWDAWLGSRVLKAMLGLLVVALSATVLGAVLLWPTGEGRRTAINQADAIGLVTERLEATVVSVRDGPCSYSSPGNEQRCREVAVRPRSGVDAGAVVTLAEFSLEAFGFAPDLSVGDEVILGYEDGTNFYFYADRERRGSLALLAGLFALVVLALARWRGLLALAAMVVTVVVLVGFVAPAVLDGGDPVLVALVGASGIAFVSLYLTHGATPTTTVALVGTLLALGLTLGLSWVFFEMASFTGLASEEGLTLPIVAEGIDMSSLLLGGAMIGALGALDDVTVTQVATVAELHQKRPDLGTRELMASGVRIGREHIAATVNTLLLAYAGASMPLLLLFSVSEQSLDMVANSELLAVEIVRTLCGSIGLVAAVPVTTALAAVLVTSRGTRNDAEDDPPPRNEPPRWEDFGPEPG
jgi:uncharacterized membrane protein